MAVSLSVAGADLVTNAAALAGTDSNITEAQFVALGNLLIVLSKRKDLSNPALILNNDDDVSPG